MRSKLWVAALPALVLGLAACDQQTADTGGSSAPATAERPSTGAGTAGTSGSSGTMGGGAGTTGGATTTPPAAGGTTGGAANGAGSPPRQ